MVAPNVISKLAAIVGRCDLLNESNQTIESPKQIRSAACLSLPGYCGLGFAGLLSLAAAFRPEV